jgi:hypothetical protein
MAYELHRNRIKIVYEYKLTSKRFITSFEPRQLLKYPEFENNPLPTDELKQAFDPVKNSFPGKNSDGLYLFKLTDAPEPQIIQETEIPNTEKQAEIDNTRLEKALSQATIKFYKGLANGTLDTITKIKQFFQDEIANYQGG